MPFDPAAVAAAVARQEAAAQDARAQVRLIAGPGTGKSHTIEEAALWRLQQGASLKQLAIVSFTRAAAIDLRRRVVRHCTNAGIEDAEKVRVTTLHSLALRVLRRAGLLAAYPVEPNVLDEWELENIYDAELSSETKRTPSRCEVIRRDFEAYWSTGSWTPPNYEQPEPPVSTEERESFKLFHGLRTQLYACVLPGEVVRQCVDRIEAGTLSLSELGIQHLIVDEYQDLNPADQALADHFAREGATLLVAGDDDQSVYSFRFASPAGVQQFDSKYPGAGDHALEDCFRSTPVILDVADRLISDFSPPSRIPKSISSLYASATPVVEGDVFRWRFVHGTTEARSVAESCVRLIDRGMEPRDILILMGNSRVLERGLREELERAAVAFDRWGAKRFVDTDAGRLVLCLLRILTDEDDYVAYRTLLGLRDGVGPGTCAKIARLTVENNANYKDLFFQTLPDGVFDTRCSKALIAAREVVAMISDWDLKDELEQRRDQLSELVREIVGEDEAQSRSDKCDELPKGILLEELRDYLWSDSEEGRQAIVRMVEERTSDGEAPAQDPPSSGVRLMTMHGAKGLDAKVVFVPGLEDEFFPGRKRMPYPGQVLEAARLLYVSITRARAACVLSYAARRFVYGQTASHPASRFTGSLGGTFKARKTGLTNAEADSVLATCAEL